MEIKMSNDVSLLISIHGDEQQLQLGEFMLIKRGGLVVIKAQKCSAGSQKCQAARWFRHSLNIFTFHSFIIILLDVTVLFNISKAFCTCHFHEVFSHWLWTVTHCSCWSHLSGDSGPSLGRRSASPSERINLLPTTNLW